MTNYDGQRLCAVEDTLGVGEQWKWPSPNPTWSIVADLPGFAMASFQSAVEEALGYWQKVCGVKPQFIGNSPNANLVIGIQTIGPGGVLADCELPTMNSMSQRCRMRIDTAEAWTIAENPPSNKVDLVRVICHEAGHGLGISHIGTGNLMAPVYSSSIRRPQSGDIVEAQARYGPPAPTTTPTPPVPPDGGDMTELIAFLKDSNGRPVIRVGGVLFGAS